MQSVEKIIGNIFYDAEGCILIAFHEPRQTINVKTLYKPCCALRNKPCKEGHPAIR